MMQGLYGFWFFLLLPFSLFAQYTGGEGAGYDMAAFEVVVNGEVDAQEPAHFAIYPNPTTQGSHVRIQRLQGESTLRIYDSKGVLIAHWEAQDRQPYWDLELDLAKGLYVFMQGKVLQKVVVW
jgi:hypothetical protein